MHWPASTIQTKQPTAAIRDARHNNCYFDRTNASTTTRKVAKKLAVLQIRVQVQLNISDRYKEFLNHEYTGPPQDRVTRITFKAAAAHYYRADHHDTCMEKPQPAKPSPNTCHHERRDSTALSQLSTKKHCNAEQLLSSKFKVGNRPTTIRLQDNSAPQDSPPTECVTMFAVQAL